MSDRLFYGFEAEKLFDARPPIGGESLLSWVARNAIENDLPNITTILRDVGQAHRNKMADVMRGDVDAEGLAVILGSDLATVRSLRGEDLGDGRMHYLGASVRHGDIHTAARRFSPEALRRDATPHYRAAWLLRTFPVCTETWRILRSSCECGAKQTWATVNTMVLCENCGADLRDLDAERVPAAAEPGLRFLADILFGDAATRSAALSRLPDAFRDLDPGDVFELALLMTRIVDPAMGNPREEVWRDKPLRLAIALAKAAELLPTWPATPWLALEVTSDPTRLHPRSPQLVSLHRVLSGDWAGGVSAPIRKLLSTLRIEHTLPDDDGPHPLVDLNGASRILGMNKKDVRARRAAGHLGRLFVIRRGEIVPGYERAKLEALAATAEWPAAYTCAKAMGLPPYGLEQLCAMDEIGWARAPHRTARHGLFIDPRAVAELEHRLRAAAVPIDDLNDAVPLSTAMRGIGGREKPWGPVIRALLEGEWEYALRYNGNVVREVVVDAADLNAIRQMAFDPTQWPLFRFGGEATQTDACDVLNVSMRGRGAIERHKVGSRNGAWIFERGDLAKLATSVVTAAELRARHRLENKTTLAGIARSGIERLDFGYRREGGIERFDAACADPRRLRRTRRR